MAEEKPMKLWSKETRKKFFYQEISQGKEPVEREVQIVAHFFENPQQNKLYDWLEIVESPPSRPFPRTVGQIEEAAKGYLHLGRPFAFFTDHALAMIGNLVRRNLFRQPPLAILFHCKDAGREHILCLDTKGDIDLWPQDGKEDITNAAFWYRYND